MNDVTLYQSTPSRMTWETHLKYLLQVHKTNVDQLCKLPHILTQHNQYPGIDLAGEANECDPTKIGSLISIIPELVCQNCLKVDQKSYSVASPNSSHIRVFTLATEGAHSAWHASICQPLRPITQPQFTGHLPSVWHLVLPPKLASTTYWAQLCTTAAM